MTALTHTSVRTGPTIDYTYNRTLNISGFADRLRGTAFYPRLTVQTMSPTLACFSLEGWASTVIVEQNRVSIRMCAYSNKVRAELEALIAACM